MNRTWPTPGKLRPGSIGSFPVSLFGMAISLIRTAAKHPRAASLLIAGLAVLAAMPAGGQAPRARPPITGISHLSVYSADASKTDDFYVRDLGAYKGADPENPQGVRYYFSLTQFVEVLPLPAGYTSINRLDHVAFLTADADGLRRYLGAQGIAVPASVQKGPDGSRWFDVKDPEDNKVQFVEAPAAPAQAPLDPLSHRIIHVGYMVHSRSAEDAFYRAVLGFRPYWFGGPSDGAVSWVSQQVPDGTDWLEYMLVSGPETKGISADMTADRLGTMDHFSLGVRDIKSAALVLYAGDRTPERTSGARIGRDGKWQYNLFSPDGTRAEIMEFQPVGKPCCSAFTASSPTE
jgi:catechol 2,3-dioxygenase-like lactoylglutathione lyase family enzyme